MKAVAVESQLQEYSFNLLVQMIPKCRWDTHHGLRVAGAAWMDTEFMKHLINLANAVDGSIQAGAKSVLELLWQDAEMMKHLTKRYLRA
jgi:hypothetical protein